MGNGYKIYEAISNIEDSLIDDAMRAEDNAVKRTRFSIAVAAAAAVAITTVAVVVPTAVIASRRQNLPPVETVDNSSTRETGEDVDKIMGEDVLHVQNHEVITIEDLRKRERFSRLLPSKLLKNAVQVSGINMLYDPLAAEHAVYHDDDPVSYTASFFIDPQGLLSDEDKAFGVFSPVPYNLGLAHMIINFTKTAYFAPLDPPDRYFSPEQLTVEAVRSCMSDVGFSIGVVDGDYFVEYLFWYNENGAVPAAEEIYDMITSASCFNLE